MKRSEEAQQVMRLDWGELSVKRRRLARRLAGQCEKDTAEQSQPSPLWDCTGTEVALGPQEEECTGLRLHHVSASLRTEAQGTRKSSEVAHGVFSRIRVDFFFLLPVSGSSAHLNWSAKYTWGNEQMYAHVCTRTCLLHVRSLLVHEYHLKVSTPAGWACCPWLESLPTVEQV